MVGQSGSLNFRISYDILPLALGPTIPLPPSKPLPKENIDDFEYSGKHICKRQTTENGRLGLLFKFLKMQPQLSIQTSAGF